MKTVKELIIKRSDIKMYFNVDAVSFEWHNNGNKFNSPVYEYYEVLDRKKLMDHNLNRFAKWLGQFDEFKGTNILIKQ